LQEDDDTPVLDSEVNLVNWEHPIGKKVSLNSSSICDKKHYLKVFKTWRQSKKTGGPVRDDLRVAHKKYTEHLAESWEAFLKKYAAGNITKDIRKRTEGKEGKSLYPCRQKVHRQCTKRSSDIPCYIWYREGECRLCGKGKGSLEESKQNMSQYPNEDLWDEEQIDAIYRYESARAAHQEAMQRRQAITNYDERGTRRAGQGHLVGGLPTVHKYRSSGNILPSERERLSRRSESAYPDRKEPDQSRYDQYNPR
jgi:hypothetical protein